MKSGDFNNVMDVYRTREAKLIGGFYCRLTDDEINEWDRFIRQHPGRRRLLEIERHHEVKRRLLSRTDVPASLADELLAALRERDELLDSLFEVGATWFAGVMAARS
jgi:hypothetical protein